MSCIDCSNCYEANPIISPCTQVTVRFGYAPAAATDYVLEFEKQSGIKRQLSVTSGGSNEITVDFSTLSGFDAYFTKDAGPYLVRLLDSGGEIVSLNDQALLPSDRDVECILVSFDNVGANATITGINLSYEI